MAGAIRHDLAWVRDNRALVARQARPRAGRSGRHRGGPRTSAE